MHNLIFKLSFEICHILNSYSIRSYAPALFYFSINHSVGDINYQSLNTVTGTAFKDLYFLSQPVVNCVIFLIYILSGIAFSGFSLAFTDT